MRNFGWLNEYGLASTARAMNDAREPMSMIDGDWQNIMIAADGCVGITQNFAQFRITQEMLDATLHLLIDGNDLLADLCEFGAGHVEHVAARVDAAGDGFGDQAEVFNGGHECDQALMEFAEPHAPAIHVAGAGECAGDVEQLFRGEHGANPGAACEHAHVLEPRERRRLPLTEHVDHLRDQFELGANSVRVGAWLN